MFYPGDWRKDPAVQSLDYESRGVWFELICIMWECPERGRLLLENRAMTTTEISHILGLSVGKTEEVLTNLLSKGVAKKDPETGVIYCKRITDEQHIKKVRAIAGSIGGSKKQANIKQSTESEYVNENDNESENDKEVESWFEGLWVLYPNKDGRKDALKYFKSTVSNSNDLANCKKALENYLKSDRVKNGYVKNGSTWFNNWKDWVDYTDPPKGANDGKNKGIPAGTSFRPDPGKYDKIGS